MSERRCGDCESLFHITARCPRGACSRRHVVPAFQIARNGVTYDVRADTYEAAERRLDEILRLVA